MPRFVCDTCTKEVVVTVDYKTMNCVKCKKPMRLTGATPVLPTTTSASKPLPPLPVKPVTVNKVAPTINLAELKQKATEKSDQRTVNATISKTLQYVMNDGTSNRNFNYPIKYRLWISDSSKQSTEVTIEIPIKVYGGAEAANYWTSKGYSLDSFTKTSHGNKPGVSGATLTEDVKKAWSAKINKTWGKVGVIWVKPSKEINLYTLKFQFSFVDKIELAVAGVACVQTTGEAKTVNPNGTIDAIRWGVEDIDETKPGPICHEVGHFIGNPDEYYTITYEGVTKAWGPGYQAGATFGIMNNPDHEPFIRNYKNLALDLTTRFGIPQAEASLLEDISMPSTSKRFALSGAFWT